MIRRPLAALLSIVVLSDSLFAPVAQASLWAERRPSLTAASSHSSSVASPAALASRLAPFGRIRYGPAPRESRGLVILFEDIHRNAEAQSNIARALRDLSGTIGAVGLEGAFDEVELSPLRAFADRELVAASADFLLRELKIPGALHAAATSRDFPLLRGVDDRRLYDRNVSAVRASHAARGAAEAFVRRRLDESARRAAGLNRPLRRLLEADAAYEEGRLRLGAYIQALNDAGAATPATRRFAETLEMEARIDFGRAEAERTEFIALLSPRLPAPARERLVRRSLEFRVGRVSPTAFYDELGAAARGAGLELGRWRTLSDYMRYLRAADGISAGDLFSEIHSARDAAFRRLAVSDEERAVVHQARLARLEKKLVALSLTPDDWREYKSLRSGNEGVMAPFASFYAEAEARDEALAANMDRLIAASERKVNAIVSGGFHAAGIEVRLSARGYQIARFTPRVSRADGDPAGYLSVFSQDKSPLEKLFRGERLFLAEEIHPGASRGLLSLFAVVFGVWRGRLRSPQETFRRLDGSGRLRDARRSDDAVVLDIDAGGRPSRVSVPFKDDRPAWPGDIDMEEEPATARVRSAAVLLLSFAVSTSAVFSIAAQSDSTSLLPLIVLLTAWFIAWIFAFTLWILRRNGVHRTPRGEEAARAAISSAVDVFTAEEPEHPAPEAAGVRVEETATEPLRQRAEGLISETENALREQLRELGASGDFFQALEYGRPPSARWKEFVQFLLPVWQEHLQSVARARERAGDVGALLALEDSVRTTRRLIAVLPAILHGVPASNLRQVRQLFDAANRRAARHNALLRKGPREMRFVELLDFCDNALALAIILRRVAYFQEAQDVLNEAIAHAEGFHRHYSRNERYINTVGRMFHYAGRADDGLRFLQSAPSRRHFSVRYWEQLGLLYQQAGRAQEGLSVLWPLRAKYFDDVDFGVQLGSLFFYAARTEEGIRWMESLARRARRPRRHGAYLGRLYLQRASLAIVQSQWNEAESALGRADRVTNGDGLSGAIAAMRKEIRHLKRREPVPARRTTRLNPSRLSHIILHHTAIALPLELAGANSFFPTSAMNELADWLAAPGRSMADVSPQSSPETEIAYVLRDKSDRDSLMRIVRPVAFGMTWTAFPTGGNGLWTFRHEAVEPIEQTNMAQHSSVVWNGPTGTGIWLRWGTAKWGLRSVVGRGGDALFGALAPEQRERFVWMALHQARAHGWTPAWRPPWYRRGVHYYEITPHFKDQDDPLGVLHGRTFYIAVDDQTLNFLHISETPPEPAAADGIRHREDPRDNAGASPGSEEERVARAARAGDIEGILSGSGRTLDLQSIDGGPAAPDALRVLDAERLIVEALRGAAEVSASDRLSRARAARLRAARGA